MGVTVRLPVPRADRKQPLSAAKNRSLPETQAVLVRTRRQSAGRLSGTPATEPASHRHLVAVPSPRRVRLSLFCLVFKESSDSNGSVSEHDGGRNEMKSTPRLRTDRTIPNTMALCPPRVRAGSPPQGRESTPPRYACRTPEPGVRTRYRPLTSRSV